MSRYGIGMLLFGAAVVGTVALAFRRTKRPAGKKRSPRRERRERMVPSVSDTPELAAPARVETRFVSPPVAEKPGPSHLEAPKVEAVLLGVPRWKVPKESLGPPRVEPEELFFGEAPLSCSPLLADLLKQPDAGRETVVAILEKHRETARRP